MKHMRKVVSIIVLTAAIGVCHGENRPNPNYPNLEEVVIVYKTHFDIGYSGLAREVVHKYRTEMLDHALDNIAVNSKNPKDRQFVWTTPGWLMQQILWKGQQPERKALIEQSFREGNLVVHALPFTTHTAMNELEEMVRGMGFSSKLSRKYGLELPRDAKMTDVPCHVWFLPTLLKHAGVDFFHFGCNLTNQMPKVPQLFWWEGPDGSRVMTMASQGYGTSALPPKGWPYKAWVYINQTGDNEGPPSLNTVANNLKFYEEKLPGVKVKIGRLSDFFDAIKKSGAELPVVRKDMPDTWIHGPMVSPNAVAESRRTKLDIGTAENMQTQMKLWGVFLTDETAAFQKAYEQSLLFGEHTWGLAAQHYRTPLYGKDWEQTYDRGLPSYMKYLETSWDEHDQYIRNATQTISAPLYNQISTLADQVNQPGRRLVVYNPLPWKRSGQVALGMCYWPRPKALKAVDSGELIPVWFEARPAERGGSGGCLMFHAKEVPAMGYRTFIPVFDQEIAEQKTLSVNSQTLESPFFKLTLDPVKGGVASLIDKRTNRELVDVNAPCRLGQYLYERFSKNEVMRFLNAYLYPRFMHSHGPITGRMTTPADAHYATVAAQQMQVSFEKNPLSVSATLTGEIPGPGRPQKTAVTFTLYQYQPYVDITVDISKPVDAWPEAGWICLPFRIDSPEYKLGRLGGITRFPQDIAENSNFRMLWLNTGMMVHNQTSGIGLCPIDSPLVSLGEPGCYRFDSAYTPQKPYVYVNLYNNMWATNFREWWGGRLSSTVRLWSFEGANNESTLITPALEARVPMIVARSSAKPGPLPVSQAGIEISRKGIQVTTFGQNPDGDGILLRLWEQAGLSGPCQVRFPASWNITRVQPVDLRGRKIGNPIPVYNHVLETDVHSFAPTSLLIYAK